MDVLATRSLSYRNKNGDEREVVLTVFMPFAEHDRWTCGFVFSPPIHRKTVYLYGVDFIQAFLGCLEVARGYLEGTELNGRTHWQGMLDCGLPWRAERPASWGPADIPPPETDPRDTTTLATRSLTYPDEHGTERELVLTVFAPFQAEDEIWKCGIRFGPPLNSPIYCGVGADYIEALLDGLATARVIYEAQVPQGWEPEGDLHTCSDLPYKIGRSFWKDAVHDQSSDEREMPTE